MATIREEDALSQMGKEAKELEKGLTQQQRELRLRAQQLERLRMQYEAEREGGQDVAEQEAEMQAYILRLKEVEGRAGDAREGSSGAGKTNRGVGGVVRDAVQLRAPVAGTC